MFDIQGESQSISKVRHTITTNFKIKSLILTIKGNTAYSCNIIYHWRCTRMIQLKIMATNKSLLFLIVTVSIIIYYSFIFYTVTKREISNERDLKNRLAKEQESNFNDYLWGSYRGNLYFGMRTRTPQALLTGLMWFGIDSFQGDQCKLSNCFNNIHLFPSNTTFL